MLATNKTNDAKCQTNDLQSLKISIGMMMSREKYNYNFSSSPRLYPSIIIRLQFDRLKETKVI